MKRHLLKYMTVVVVAIVLTIIIRIAVLGEAQSVELAPAAPLAGAVARGLGPNSQTSGNLPVAGKDFQISKVKYFDKGQWAVASYKPVNGNFDPGILVMKKINGVYQTMMGPGAFFSVSYTYELPTDVSQYLTSQGVIHND